MAWQRLKVPRSELPEWKRKTRFLVDENLDAEAAAYLRTKGFNAVSVEEVGLKGHSDEDVFAFAWQEKRILLTLDHDYQNDQRFPEHRNPGVVILSGGGGDGHAFGTNWGLAMAVFGSAPALWEKTKITIGGDGHMTVRRRDFDTGEMRILRFRRAGRHYEQWNPEVGEPGRGPP